MRETSTFPPSNPIRNVCNVCDFINLSFSLCMFCLVWTPCCLVIFFFVCVCWCVVLCGEMNSSASSASHCVSVRATEFSSRFLEFVNYAVSPFHAVDAFSKRLVDAGYTRISERSSWKLEKGGRYFFTRNGSTLVAFAVGGQYNAEKSGFHVVCAHTDSPDFKLKPISKKSSNSFVQVGVQTYGGGLWHTWFDRDLTVGGRVLVRENGSVAERLVHIQRPILRIPSLAIHLDRSVREGFKFNEEEQLIPVLATQMMTQLGLDSRSEESETTLSATANGRHSPLLLELISNELGCSCEDIVDLELDVVDTQPATIAGAYGEFIFSPRLDNLMSCFCALESMLSPTSEDSISQDNDVRVIAFFDNEEVGSDSNAGAGSTLLKDFFHRFSETQPLETGSSCPEDFHEASLARSFIISADMAHALHPNYASKHEAEHRPYMHKGVVIKHNVNMRYATNSRSASIVRLIADRVNVPVQDFVVRNDSPCGSTIGPILASNTSVESVDVGIPQLSMHSIREMCGVNDVEYYIDFFVIFLRLWTKNKLKMEVECEDKMFTHFLMCGPSIYPDHTLCDVFVYLAHALSS